MQREEIEKIVTGTHERFEEIFGFRATVSAAPGWTATTASLEIEEANGIQVTSHTRGGSPFHPRRADGTASRIIELPSTIPTLDEVAGWDEYAGVNREKTTDYFRDLVLAPPRLHIHSIHTEIEGGKALGPLFVSHVEAWKAAGVEFITLGQAAREASREPLPVRQLDFAYLKGRATPVAVGR
jgi:undecaprenyl phosphate-alpha-L-ara4FN deformylase